MLFVDEKRKGSLSMNPSRDVERWRGEVRDALLAEAVSVILASDLEELAASLPEAIEEAERKVEEKAEELGEPAERMLELEREVERLTEKMSGKPVVVQEAIRDERATVKRSLQKARDAHKYAQVRKTNVAKTLKRLEHTLKVYREAAEEVETPLLDALAERLS
jgi:chromosome segregation ATPase